MVVVLAQLSFHVLDLVDLTFIFHESQVIRENQVVVVVGETGSGKTTQMTQVRPLIIYLLDQNLIGNPLVTCFNALHF